MPRPPPRPEKGTTWIWLKDCRIRPLGREVARGSADRPGDAEPPLQSVLGNKAPPLPSLRMRGLPVTRFGSDKGKRDGGGGGGAGGGGGGGLGVGLSV